MANILLERLLQSTIKEPTTKNEVATIGEELDALSGAYYMVGRRRLERSLKPLVRNINAQLRRDTSHVTAMTSYRFDTVGALSGIPRGIQATASEQMRLVRYGLSRYMSPSLQASAETVAFAVLRAHTVLRGVAFLEEHVRVRKLRDAGYTMLTRHIEMGNGIRSIADNLRSAAASDFQLAATQRMAKATHEQNMKRIQWETERQKRAARDAKSDMMGQMFGEFLGGFTTGFKF